MPPGPHKVSARTSPSSLASSARSRSRPTKLLGSAGRLPSLIAVWVLAMVLGGRRGDGLGRRCYRQFLTTAPPVVVPAGVHRPASVIVTAAGSL